VPLLKTNVTKHIADFLTNQNHGDLPLGDKTVCGVATLSVPRYCEPMTQM